VRLSRVCEHALERLTDTCLISDSFTKRGAFKTAGGVLGDEGGRAVLGVGQEANAVTFSLVIHYFSNGSNNKCIALLLHEKKTHTHIREKGNRNTHAQSNTRVRAGQHAYTLERNMHF